MINLLIRPAEQTLLQVEIQCLMNHGGDVLAAVADKARPIQDTIESEGSVCGQMSSRLFGDA